MNPVAIESYLRLVLLQWVVIILVAWGAGLLARRLGQPRAVGEIAGGLMLGPSLFGALAPEAQAWLFRADTQPTIQVLAKIGLILLLFQVGMEFDFSHLTSRTRAVTGTALAGILAPAGLGLLIAPWLHREFAPDVGRQGFTMFVCVALSISALPIMGRILMELGLERTPLAALAISSAAIDDVVGWVGLAAITAIVTSGFDPGAMTLQVAGILALFAALMYVVGPLVTRAWRASVSRLGRPEITPSFLALLLSVLMVCCLATNALGIFSIFGAFLLGVSLHREVALAQAWRSGFSQMVLVAFVPIFFTNTGLRTHVGSLADARAWIACGLVLAAATIGKLGGCYVGARLGGQPHAEAASVAALMNTRALMGLVAINVGADLGFLPRELFTMFVIMALLTTVSTQPLLRRVLPEELRRIARWD